MEEWLASHAVLAFVIAGKGLQQAWQVQTIAQLSDLHHAAILAPFSYYAGQGAKLLRLPQITGYLVCAAVPGLVPHSLTRRVLYAGLWHRLRPLHLGHPFL